MLKIGEFSKLSRVSVRMLRHYDEIGLLKPAEIDRFTDYRYYREDQLPIAGRIAALKDMGFSLADIVRILEVYDDREKLEQFFSAKQQELEALSKDTAYKLTLLDAARTRLRKEEDMSYNVTLKTIPERYAATVHMTISRYEDEGIIWGKMAEETCRMDLVGKTVRGSYPDTEHVKFRTLPEVTVASCTYQGSYIQITDVYTAVIAWMEANGYEPAEPMFNIYHVSPHETQNPDEFVTEICYPVKKK